MSRRCASLVIVVIVATGCATSGRARTRITIPSPGDCAPIDVAAAPDVAAAVRTIADRFNDSDAARLPEGRCAFVRTWSTESATVARELLAGWPRPQVIGPMPAIWIPASSAWPRLVNERRSVRGTVGPATIGRSLARNRVVVAMPKPMAKALHAPLSWSDLATAAARGWGAYGHRPWGRFLLGRANPALSTDSLLATLALDGDAATAQTLERSVGAYGSSADGFFANWLSADAADAPLANMAAVASAVITDERALRAYNLGSPTGLLPVSNGASAPAIKLVAVNRVGAAPAADYPFVRLRSSNAALRAFERFVETPDAERVFTDAGFRRGGTPAHAPLAVAGPLDRWSSYRKAGRVLVLFDVSDSMRDSAGPALNDRPKLAVAKTALIDALDRLGPRDEIGLRIFTTKIRKGPSTNWQDLVAIGPLADNRRRLVRQIRSLRPRQGSPLYAATHDAFTKVHRSIVASAINGIVLITDGYNEDDRNNDRDALLRYLGVDPRVHVYTIAYGGDADVSTLGRIANATPGATYGATSPINIETAFADALANF